MARTTSSSFYKAAVSFTLSKHSWQSNHRLPTRIPGIPLLVLILSISFLVQPLFAAPSGRQTLPPLVSVIQVVEKDIVAASEYVGHVEAIQSVDLRARVEGFLEKVNFREGDVVQAGDLLYIIEQAPYRARVKARQADVLAARAELDRTSQHLKRLRTARPESVRATDMDNARAAELSAQARLEAARAALTLTELDLQYTSIKAPISGRIGRTSYTRGNLVNPASGSLARIVQTNPIWVMYAVSENEVDAIREAMDDGRQQQSKRLLAPQIRLGNGTLYPETGYIVFVDNQVDSSTGTIIVRAQFNNPDGRLIPGQYVSVLVKSTAARLMPVIPQAAVLVNKKGRYVMVVDKENRTSARPITIGPALGPLWTVTSGLQPGENVILHGIQKVRPGQTVRIKPESKTER